MRIILSPHYDDAVFSLGGMIASNPQECVVVTVFAGVPSAYMESWWDKKCGFLNSVDAMNTRAQENAKALKILGLHQTQVIDLPLLEKQYRTVDAEEAGLYTAILNALNSSPEVSEALSQSGEIYAPINTFNEDHAIIQNAAIKLAKLRGIPHIFLYEDMPYQVRLSTIPSRKKTMLAFSRGKRVSRFTFSKKQWSLKSKAVHTYRTQFVGIAHFLGITIFLYNKISALCVGKPYSYTEKVLAIQCSE